MVPRGEVRTVKVLGVIPVLSDIKYVPIEVMRISNPHNF